MLDFSTNSTPVTFFHRTSSSALQWKPPEWAPKLTHAMIVSSDLHNAQAKDTLLHPKSTNEREQSDHVLASLTVQLCLDCQQSDRWPCSVTQPWGEPRNKTTVKSLYERIFEKKKRVRWQNKIWKFKTGCVGKSQMNQRKRALTNPTTGEHERRWERCSLLQAVCLI